MSIKFSVTQYGEKLDKSKYSWNEATRTFSTNEGNLVLDFSDMDYCTFNTGFYCTFDTGSHCTFKTGYNCTFKTGSLCTFKTGSLCTFDTGDGCTFESGKNSVVIRRDIFQVIQLIPNQKIKLNDYHIKGYTVIDPEPVKPSCNGKVVEIDGKKYKLQEID